MKIAALLLLSVIPILAGVLRLIDLGGGGHPDPETSARFAADPLPVAAHIMAATTFCVVGAFQFSGRLRRSSWHRRAGRVVLVAGMVAAAAGIWLAFSSPPIADGGLLLVLRGVFGSGMAAALVLGLLAARRGQLQKHRAWMIRAYAIGVAAGTQSLFGILTSMVGVDAITDSALMGLAWLINLMIAELIIRHGGRRSPSSAPSPRTGALRRSRPADTSGR
jgi:uncharacterized membrane protein